MRKRNVHIQFWLDKKEAEVFQKKVKRSGLSREAYLRHLVNGLEPQDAPPPDYYAMMRELHGIGNNLNQIAVKAHTLNVSMCRGTTRTAASWMRLSKRSPQRSFCPTK